MRRQQIVDVSLAVKYNTGSSQFRDDFALPPGKSTVGRHNKRDIRIRSPSVSSHHAEIEVGLNCVTLRHLTENSKTWIRPPSGSGRHPRSQPLATGATYVLKSGQSFDLGDVTCTITYRDIAEDSAPARPSDGRRSSSLLSSASVHESLAHTVGVDTRRAESVVSSPEDDTMPMSQDSAGAGSEQHGAEETQQTRVRSAAGTISADPVGTPAVDEGMEDTQVLVANSDEEFDDDAPPPTAGQGPTVDTVSSADSRTASQMSRSSSQKRPQSPNFDDEEDEEDMDDTQAMSDSHSPNAPGGSIAETQGFEVSSPNDPDHSWASPMAPDLASPAVHAATEGAKPSDIDDEPTQAHVAEPCDYPGDVSSPVHSQPFNCRQPNENVEADDTELDCEATQGFGVSELEVQPLHGEPSASPVHGEDDALSIPATPETQRADDFAARGTDVEEVTPSSAPTQGLDAFSSSVSSAVRSEASGDGSARRGSDRKSSSLHLQMSVSQTSDLESEGTDAGCTQSSAAAAVSGVSPAVSPHSAATQGLDDDGDEGDRAPAKPDVTESHGTSIGGVVAGARDRDKYDCTKSVMFPASASADMETQGYDDVPNSPAEVMLSSQTMSPAVSPHSAATQAVDGSDDDDDADTFPFPAVDMPTQGLDATLQNSSSNRASAANNEPKTETERSSNSPLDFDPDMTQGFDSDFDDEDGDASDASDVLLPNDLRDRQGLQTQPAVSSAAPASTTEHTRGDSPDEDEEDVDDAALILPTQGAHGLATCDSAAALERDTTTEQLSCKSQAATEREDSPVVQVDDNGDSLQTVSCSNGAETQMHGVVASTQHSADQEATLAERVLKSHARLSPRKSIRASNESAAADSSGVNPSESGAGFSRRDAEANIKEFFHSSTSPAKPPIKSVSTEPQCDGTAPGSGRDFDPTLQSARTECKMDTSPPVHECAAVANKLPAPTRLRSRSRGQSGREDENTTADNSKDEAGAPAPAVRSSRRSSRRSSAGASATGAAADADDHPGQHELEVFRKGDSVLALYAGDGRKYHAVVSKVNQNKGGVVSSYQVKWDDGSTKFRTVKPDQIWSAHPDDHFYSLSQPPVVDTDDDDVEDVPASGPIVRSRSTVTTAAEQDEVEEADQENQDGASEGKTPAVSRRSRQKRSGDAAAADNTTSPAEAANSTKRSRQADADLISSLPKPQLRASARPKSSTTDASKDKQAEESERGAQEREAEDDAPAAKRNKTRGLAAADVFAGAVAAKAATQRTTETTKRRRGETAGIDAASGSAEQGSRTVDAKIDASAASRPKRQRSSTASASAPAAVSAPAVVSPAARTTAQRGFQRSKGVQTAPAPVCTANTRPVVAIFTGFDNKSNKLQDLESIVNDLGGQVTKSADDCTHVVFESNKVAKTEKSLVAISRGCIFTTTKWLTESKRANRWQDSTKFIVRDRSLERELGFELPVSIARAQHNEDAGSKLLEGKEVFALKGVGKGNHDAVCHIVEAAGARFCKRTVGKRRNSSQGDDILVIAEPETDAAEIGRLKAAGHRIHDWKAVSSSLLAQERRFTESFEL